MKADPCGTPAEQARARIGWRTANKGDIRCDGCIRSTTKFRVNGGANNVQCDYVHVSTKPNATCNTARHVEIIPANQSAALADFEQYTQLENKGQQMTDKKPPAIPEPQVMHISEETQKVLILVGRIQSAMMQATVAQRIVAESYLKIKESKGWIGIIYKDKEGESAIVASLDEFCRHHFGNSQRRCQEFAANLHLLGPELYEQAEAIGLGQRDYNALKALPADDQLIVKQAIETEDRSRIIDLLQEMAVKHGKEKEVAERKQAELTQQIDKKQAEIEAKDRNIKKKSDEISDLKDKLDDKKARELTEDPMIARREDYIKDMMGDAINIHASISATLRQRCLAVFDGHDLGYNDEHARLVVSQALGLVGGIIRSLAIDLSINPNNLPEVNLLEAMHGEGAASWAAVNQQLKAQEQENGND